MKSVKIEKGIRYCEELDSYYVQFNYSPAGEAHLRCFPTLEDARAYRDTINAAKLDAKIKKDLAIIYKHDLEEIGECCPYPYNAFSIAGLKEEDIDPDTIKNFEEILKEACENVRDRDCFHLIFEQGKTLQATGEKFDLTRERVRQIVSKVLKDTVSLINKRKLKAKEEIDLADRHALREKLIEAYKATGVITPELEYEFGELRRGSVLDRNLIYIHDLDLSARSFNCLTKAEIYTVNELVSYPVSEIAALKNMGKKSLNEIISKVKELGFEFVSE